MALIVCMLASLPLAQREFVQWRVLYVTGFVGVAALTVVVVTMYLLRTRAGWAPGWVDRWVIAVPILDLICIALTRWSTVVWPEAWSLRETSSRMSGSSSTTKM